MVLGCQLVFGSHSSFSSEMPVPYINFLKKERRDFAFSLLMLIVSALFFVCLLIFCNCACSVCLKLHDLSLRYKTQVEENTPSM